MLLKSQVSVEYLAIMGFVAVMIIPLAILYYTYVADSGDEIITSQIYQIAAKIVDSAESVYSLGEPSQTVLKVHMPSQIRGASLDNREVLFNVSIRGGMTQIVRVSSVDLKGQLPVEEGLYAITLKATGKNVSVSYK